MWVRYADSEDATAKVLVKKSDHGHGLCVRYWARHRTKAAARPDRNQGDGELFV
jgi:hypothetical protein